MATSPAPPSKVTLSQVNATSVHATFGDGNNNGAPITAREIGYGTSDYEAQKRISSDQSTTITGLTPGTKYFFKARTKNSQGWSDWGPATSATTLSAVRVKVGSTWKLALPYVRVAGVWRLARPWVRENGTWKPTI